MKNEEIYRIKDLFDPDRISPAWPISQGPGLQISDTTIDKVTSSGRFRMVWSDYRTRKRLQWAQDLADQSLRIFCKEYRGLTPDDYPIIIKWIKENLPLHGFSRRDFVSTEELGIFIADFTYNTTLGPEYYYQMEQKLTIFQLKGVQHFVDYYSRRLGAFFEREPYPLNLAIERRLELSKQALAFQAGIKGALRAAGYEPPFLSSG